MSSKRPATDVAEVTPVKVRRVNENGKELPEKFEISLKESARVQHLDDTDQEFEERWQREIEEMNNGGVSQWGGPVRGMAYTAM